VDDDYLAALEFVVHAHLNRPVQIVRHVSDVPSLIEELSNAAIVVGMRLHSLVLAVGLGRPVAALAYDRKVTGFMRDIGGEGSSRPLGNVTADWLAGRMRAALEEGDCGYDSVASTNMLSRTGDLADLLRAWQ
jgi:polysaccharide pyruvyl transferase WcaK-like protein